MNRILTTRALISSPSGILLIQRSKNGSLPLFWELPGGTIELGDKTNLTAIVREVQEETGLIIPNFQYIGNTPVLGSRGDVLDCHYWIHRLKEEIGVIDYCRVEAQDAAFFSGESISQLQVTHSTRVGMLLAKSKSLLD